MNEDQDLSFRRASDKRLRQRLRQFLGVAASDQLDQSLRRRKMVTAAALLRHRAATVRPRPVQGLLRLDMGSAGNLLPGWFGEARLAWFAGRRGDAHPDIAIVHDGHPWLMEVEW